MTVKTEGSGTFHSGGAMSITADGGVGLMSRDDSVSIAGATQVGIVAAGGEVAIQSGGETHINASKIHMDGPGDINLNSGTSKKASDIVTAKAPKKPKQQPRLGPRDSLA
jgi:hypothetical protein